MRGDLDDGECQQRSLDGAERESAGFRSMRAVCGLRKLLVSQPCFSPSRLSHSAHTLHPSAMTLFSLLDATLT